MSYCGCCDDEEENEQRNDGTVRSCTDLFWLFLYIAFWSLMLLVAAFSFVYGNPIRIVNGYDSFGNTCGTKHNKKLGNLDLSGIDTSDKPYLLFFDMNSLRNSLKICVNQCPSKYIEDVAGINNYYRQTKQEICRYGFNYDDLTSRKIFDKRGLVGTFGPCPNVPIYASTPVLNRCVPLPVKELAHGVLSDFYALLNSWDTLEQILGDIYKTWRVILGLAFLSLVLSLLIITVLHLLAYLVSYIIMVFATIASIGGTAFLWYTYFDIKYNLDKTNKEMVLLEAARNESAFFWYSIIATIITIIILLLVFVMRKKVDFLADLFKETSKCVMQLPGIFLQPMITFTVLMAFYVFWVIVILNLSTSYYPGKTDITTINNTTTLTAPTTATTNVSAFENFGFSSMNKMTIVEFIDPSWVKYMWWIYFIGLIWTSEFIMGCQSLVIAGAVAHWYYRSKYKSNNHVMYAICKLIKYHLGSVAKGSLLITIFKVPRLILMYLHQKLKRNEESQCASCCLKGCICCFYCLEKFIRYLNHNAYTVIAIDGVHFCKAAKTAFEVLVSHSLEVATINSIGDFILFLGKCIATAVTGCVGLYLFRKDEDLKFFAAPTLIVCIFAFFISHCILSLYEMVLDTIYLCQCQSGEGPLEVIQMQQVHQVQAQSAPNGNNSTIEAIDNEECSANPVNPEENPLK